MKFNFFLFIVCLFLINDLQAQQKYTEVTDGQITIGTYRLKNRHTPNQWINVKPKPSEIAIASSVTNDDQYAWWDFEIAKDGKDGTDFFRLVTHVNNEICLYLHPQDLLALDMVSGKRSLSAEWKVEAVKGTKFFRLKNRAKPKLYLNTEKGELEATDVPAGFHSSHWIIERAE